MTLVFWAFPEIAVREPRKPQRKGQYHKYDHWQMLQDRIAGMSWADIERKHGVTCSGQPGHNARHLAINSTAIRKLRPSEAAALCGFRAKPKAA